MRIGIDATGLVTGGGRTHLLALLSHSNPSKHGFDSIVIWSDSVTLSKLPDYPWILKIPVYAGRLSQLYRMFWYATKFAREFEKHDCDILFSPNGLALTRCAPVVTMSRNLLPFEWSELVRYGLSATTLRLLLLRVFQSKSMQSASGVIFLTRYAETKVRETVLLDDTAIAVVSHGVNVEAFSRRRPERDVEVDEKSPLRFIYVSAIEPYKHQCKVVAAMASARERLDREISLTLVGPGKGRPLRELHDVIRKWDPNSKWIEYLGSVEHADMSQLYQNSDVAIFASSCENLPNILLEAMSSGIPIICSDMGPMPEVLEDAGIYFNPQDVVSISGAIEDMARMGDHKYELGIQALEKSRMRTWEDCTDKTFEFLRLVMSQHHK